MRRDAVGACHDDGAVGWTACLLRASTAQSDRRSPTAGSDGEAARCARAHPRTGPRGIGEFQGLTPLQGSFLKIATPQIEHFLYRYTSF
jgi:hypothetical protein